MPKKDAGDASDAPQLPTPDAVPEEARKDLQRMGKAYRDPGMRDRVPRMGPAMPQHGAAGYRAGDTPSEGEHRLGEAGDTPRGGGPGRDSDGSRYGAVDDRERYGGDSPTQDKDKSGRTIQGDPTLDEDA